MISRYAFWFILSKITTPQVIGISSSVASLAAIFVTIASIGVPIGIQRLLGKRFFEQKFEDTKVVVTASLLILSFGVIACTILIFITKDWLYNTLDFSLIVVSLVLIGSSSISVLFRYILIASLKTKKLVLVSILSTAAKLVLTIVLVLMGTGAFGVTIGYTIYPILVSIILAFNIMTIFRQSDKKPQVKFTDSFRNVLAASIPSWIPGTIAIVRTQLGIIVILASIGVSQAGFYFIAFQIVTGLSTVIWALESTTYPALSALRYGRKRFSWQVIKMSLIIVLPLSYSIIFYSNEIMELFGRDYIEASIPLEILLVSILSNAVMNGIGTLLYSYGYYRRVLAVGLTESIPRVALYFFSHSNFWWNWCCHKLHIRIYSCLCLVNCDI